MSEDWFILSDGTNAPATNMATDAFLLDSASAIGRPVLRFYGWNEPAATFGYFQKIAEIENWTPLRPLIRRPTGGGLVPHAADWTYSLTFPRAHWWARLNATESYRKIHEWIRDAFAALTVESALSPCCQPDAPGQCFIGAEKFDLLHEGRKVAGPAQRRTQDGLLIQGSVQPVPANVLRRDWENAMRQIGTDQLSVRWQPLDLTDTMRERITTLSTDRFSNDSFNRRR